MITHIKIVRLLGSVALFLVSVSSAQKSPRAQEISGCLRFAQEFYSWYVPFTQKHLNGPASDVAIRRKPAAFTTELLRALKSDSETQTRSRGEIVGIDFDP